MRRTHALLFSLASSLALSACAQSPPTPYLEGRGGYYKVGTPYEINGKTYHPHENTKYVERGIASWYGPGFHGNLTANGETYNMNAYSAAHRTLPMPVYVRVLNLENGNSLVVRVNDRGPFAKNRIIDLSRRAAQKLGFLAKGTAHVEVRYLRRARLGERLPSYSSASWIPYDSYEDEGEGAEAQAEEEAQKADKNEEKASRGRVWKVADSYYVQVGAFIVLKNAENLRETLAEMEKAHIMTKRRSASNALYIVRLGPYSDMEEARRAQSALGQNAWNSFITDKKGKAL